jgi:hypothetical protein
VATTPHPGDIDGDGEDESIVRYRFEQKVDSPSDTYNELPGLSNTLRFGKIGDPVQLLEDGYVGPVSSFQIVFENRSDGFASPMSVDIDEIGAEVHARILRGIDREDVVRATDRIRGGEQ